MTLSNAKSYKNVHWWQNLLAAGVAEVPNVEELEKLELHFQLHKRKKNPTKTNHKMCDSLLKIRQWVGSEGG